MATPTQIRRRGRWSLILGALFAFVAFGAVAYAADIETSADLSTNILTPTQVDVGDNSFQIKVWAVGNLNNANATGQVVVVNKYFMATNGAITPSASATDRTTLTFRTSFNYTTNCTSDPATAQQGCAANPFPVTATLAVASGTTDNTTGTVTVSLAGSIALNSDPTPAQGMVEVDAPPSNTAPSVSVTNVTDGASYEIGTVPSAGCSVTDAEDGASSFAATLSAISGSLAAYGIGAQTASCSYMDDGGLTASDAKTYSIVDTIAPGIAFVSRTAANVSGWNNSDVTVNWSCSDSGSGVVNSFVTQTVSTEGANQSATGTCTDHASNTASETQNGINIDKTAPNPPTVSLSPAANAQGWNNVAVTATFAWNGDTGAVQSGEGSCTSMTTVSLDSATDAGTEVSGTCTDKASNPSASASATVKLDSVDPTISAYAGGYASGDWTNQDVTVTFTCFDALSGLLSTCPVAVLVDSNTPFEGQNVSASVSDNAGNSATSNTINVKVDKTKPTISGAASPAVDGSNGWYKTAPTVTFTCGDGLSGVASCIVDGSSPASASVTLGESSSAQTVGGTATDNAGNIEAASVAGLRVDLSNPATPTWASGGISDGGSYYFGSVPAAPGCQSSDAISGLRDCLVSGRLLTVGTHTLTATATDNAGRTSTATRSYTVLAWTLNGFYSPVDMSGATHVWNTVKNGSTVPLKFNVFAGSTELTSTSVVNQPLKAVGITCDAGTADDIELLATGGTSLRYDSTSGQFIYNWQTPKKPGACYIVTVSMQDDSSISAYFKLK
jgi:hypothetical protein